MKHVRVGFAALAVLITGVICCSRLQGVWILDGIFCKHLHRSSQII